jgi:hypothetical protein
MSDNGETFLGVGNSASSTTSPIQEIGTGLSYVPGGPSTRVHVVSLDDS